MTDHYELFGVGPDATKDEIKAAYRAEVESADTARRAQLNRAWNVLSDPIQRQRYDETLATVDGNESEDSDAAVVVPGRRATGARRGPDSTVLPTNGAARNGSGENGAASKGSADPDARPLGRAVPEPTVVLPEGMHLAAKRQRGFSIAFDVSVLAVAYILFVSLLIPAVLKDKYPHRVDRLDAISKQITKLDDQKSKAQDRESTANDQAAAAQKRGNADAVAAAKADARAAKQTANARDKQITKLQNETSDLQGKMLGTSYLLLGALLILCLLYLVPSTVFTGQTLGKRLRKLWLVRTDGSKVGWGAALAHYAVPVVIALAVPQIGPIVALGIVFWALRDRNEQGVHDKLAHTIVVDAPPGT